MSRRTFEFRVSGRVQGVWFRAWTRERAGELGLSGWVRNEADGTVTGLISGPQEAVETMLADLHNGPPNARVDRVNSTPADPDGVPAGFEIRR